MDAEYSRRGLTYVLKADSLIFLLCVWIFSFNKFQGVIAYSCELVNVFGP